MALNHFTSKLALVWIIYKELLDGVPFMAKTGAIIVLWITVIDPL